MNIPTKPLTLLTGALLLGAASSHAVIVNQYTFNDGTADDSIGGAHGTLSGTGTAATVSNGLLELYGGGDEASYLALPAGVFTNAYNGGVLGEASLSIWARANSLSNWAALYGFGPGNGGDGDYIQAVPQNGDNQNLRVTTHATADGVPEGFVDASAGLSTEVMQNLVVNFTSGGIEVFLDGSLLGTSALSEGLDLANLDDSNNALGMSQWPDPSFDGDIDEFTVHSNVLTADQVADSFAAGPVPEPSSTLLLALGGLGLIRRRR